jgi:hypothetical protein
MQKVDQPFPALSTVENQKGLAPKSGKKGRENGKKILCPLIKYPHHVGVLRRMWRRYAN